MLPNHTRDQEAANKQAWSLLPARTSVLHARSLLASNHDSPIYIHVFVRSSEWGGNARARWSLARRTYPKEYTRVRVWCKWEYREMTVSFS